MIQAIKGCFTCTDKPDYSLPIQDEAMGRVERAQLSPDELKSIKEYQISFPVKSSSAAFLNPQLRQRHMHPGLLSSKARKNLEKQRAAIDTRIRHLDAAIAKVAQNNPGVMKTYRVTSLPIVGQTVSAAHGGMTSLAEIENRVAGMTDSSSMKKALPAHPSRISTFTDHAYLSTSLDHFHGTFGGMHKNSDTESLVIFGKSGADLNAHNFAKPVNRALREVVYARETPFDVLFASDISPKAQRRIQGKHKQNSARLATLAAAAYPTSNLPFTTKHVAVLQHYDIPLPESREDAYHLLEEARAKSSLVDISAALPPVNASWIGHAQIADSRAAADVYDLAVNAKQLERTLTKLPDHQTTLRPSRKDILAAYAQEFPAARYGENRAQAEYAHNGLAPSSEGSTSAS